MIAPTVALFTLFLIGLFKLVALLTILYFLVLLCLYPVVAFWGMIMRFIRY